MFSLYGLSDARGGDARGVNCCGPAGCRFWGFRRPNWVACAAAPADASGARRRHHSCVFVFLFGGPSHIDLWDMKPQAPAEIRGEFKPVGDQGVPGIQICEHLPLLAEQMDKLCLLRSMKHRMPVHGPACSEMYTGRRIFRSAGDRPGPAARTGRRVGRWWPRFGIAGARIAAGGRAAVVLAVRRPGQADRRADRRPDGRGFNPFFVSGRPEPRRFQVQGMQLPNDVTADGSAGCARQLLDRLRSRRRSRSRCRASDRPSSQAARAAFSLLAPSQRHGASAGARTRRDARALRLLASSARACCWPGGWSRRA